MKAAAWSGSVWKLLRFLLISSEYVNNYQGLDLFLLSVCICILWVHARSATKYMVWWIAILMLSLFCKGLFLPYCHKMLCVSLLDTSNEIRDIFFFLVPFRIEWKTKAAELRRKNIIFYIFLLHKPCNIQNIFRTCEMFSFVGVQTMVVIMLRPATKAVWEKSYAVQSMFIVGSQDLYHKVLSFISVNATWLPG